MKVREFDLLIQSWLKSGLGEAEIRIDMGEDDEGSSFFSGINKIEIVQLTDTATAEDMMVVLLEPSEEDCFIQDAEDASFVPKAEEEYDN